MLYGNSSEENEILSSERTVNGALNFGPVAHTEKLNIFPGNKTPEEGKKVLNENTTHNYRLEP